MPKTLRQFQNLRDHLDGLERLCQDQQIGMRDMINLMLIDELHQIRLLLEKKPQTKPLIPE